MSGILYLPPSFLPNFISLFLSQVGVFQCCFVLAVELVGPSWRVFCGVVIEFFFVGGELILAVLAWWLRYVGKHTLLGIKELVQR